MTCIECLIANLVKLEIYIFCLTFLERFLLNSIIVPILEQQSIRIYFVIDTRSKPTQNSLKCSYSLRLSQEKMPTIEQKLKFNFHRTCQQLCDHKYLIRS